MHAASVIAVARQVLAVGVVVAMILASSGSLSEWMSAAGAAVLDDASSHRARASDGLAADNLGVCDPRPAPRIITSVNGAGQLLTVLDAATAPNGVRPRLREVWVGPLTNAAVSIGPVAARTDPFIYVAPTPSTQLSLIVARPRAGQPTHVTLFVVDECGGWPSFVGAGPSQPVVPPAATATPIPTVPGEPRGSIPISLSVYGGSQYPPGSRPRVELRTRPGAACGLSVTWPDGAVTAMPPQTASGSGLCFYRPTVPIGMRSGTATALGTAQDLFGLNIERHQFTVGGSLESIPPGDNILRVVTDFDRANENAASMHNNDNGDDGTRDNGD